MSERLTIAFVGNKELKELLDQWARENEGSVSAVLRQLIKREEARRKARPQGQNLAASKASLEAKD